MEAPRLYILTGVQIIAVGVLGWVLVTLSIPWDLPRSVGTALVVIGIAGIVIARIELGNSFSVRAEAHKLVTSGIYSKIRNPIYVCGVFMLSGVILVMHRPAWLIALFPVVIAQTIRARREARVLEAAFGDAYREYRRQTWF
jgi:protein-S-isoprenylcysteine O-methyltransferase Ste14